MMASAVELESKLQKAIALGKASGVDTTPWERRLRRLNQKEADEDYRLTMQLLATQGWCLWQCSTLNDEIIAVVRDESVRGIPEGYTVYTKAELEEVARANTSAKTIRLIHEIKKRTHATVMSVESRKERNDEALKSGTGTAKL